MFHGDFYRFPLAVHTELAEDHLEVIADCRIANIEGTCDLTGRLSLHEVIEHFLFPSRECRI